MPPGVALGLQGSDAVGGGVPALLVCGDISVLEQAGNLRASVSQDEASPQLFSFLPSVQLGLLGTPEQNVTTCFQQNSQRGKLQGRHERSGLWRVDTSCEVLKKAPNLGSSPK